MSDTGIGISDEFKKRIFRSFEQDNHASKLGVRGTGLGLAITKKLVELQGGTIDVSSTLGEGSCFNVTLKRAEHQTPLIKSRAPSTTAAMGNSAQTAAQQNQDTIEIFVICDNPIIENQIVKSFTQTSIRPRLIGTVSHLTDNTTLAQKPRAVIICLQDDQQTQNCIKAIRVKYRLSDLPIISYGDRNDTSFYVQCFELGINEFMNDGVYHHELLMRCKNMIEFYRTLDQAPTFLAARNQRDHSRHSLSTSDSHEIDYFPSTELATGYFKNILIVDDEKVNRMVLRHLLNKQGFNVYEAKNGEQALTIIHYYPIDMVLLDQMMPGLSGDETCRRIRQKYNKTQLPVIFVTGKSLPEDVAKALAAGGNDVLLKPVQQPELNIRIHIYLDILEDCMSKQPQENSGSHIA